MPKGGKRTLKSRHVKWHGKRKKEIRQRKKIDKWAE